MIELFPEQMLDMSIHTAVLLGIITLWLATESLGWVFAGFVVPGYLAAIGIVAPMSLVAIVIEAILTWGLVWAVGNGAADAGLWSRTFGRDRFLAFVLLSIPVRPVVEGLAASRLEALIGQVAPGLVGDGGGFFGIGVVLVPLLANTFWKPGLSRGLLQTGVCTALVWGLMAGVLMPLTNFHFGGFEAMFEDIAVDFLAVPKVYLVLVVTAFVAARNNIRFGWDFAGILVPALLAVIAFDPLKLLSTLVEILLLAFLYGRIMALPGVRDLNLEGPRRIVTMYTLAYGLKWVGAAVAAAFHLEFYFSDLYGFGYLLTSLVALKCWQKGAPGRVMLPLVLTTGQGLALGLLLSMGASAVFPERAAVQEPPPVVFGDVPLERAVLLSRASVVLDGPVRGRPHPASSAVLDALEELAAGASTDDLEATAHRLVAAGVSLGWSQRADGRACLGLRSSEAEEPLGVASVFWCGGPGPVLLVSRPLSDPDSLWIAGWLATQSEVAGVVIAGVDAAPASGAAGSSPWTRASLRDRLGRRPVIVVRSADAGRSYLDPRSAGAASAVGTALRPLAPLQVRFETDHGPLEPLWAQLRPSDGLLTVSLADVERESALGPGSPLPTLADRIEPLPDRGPERLVGSEEAALRVAAAEVLLGAALRAARTGEPGLPGWLVHLADVFGVHASAVEDGRGRPCWLLEEGPDGIAGWGTWVLAPGGSDRVIAAPRSGEEPGVARVARHLFEELDGGALWLAARGTRWGEGRTSATAPDGLPLYASALQVAVRPPLGARGASTAPGRLLLVRTTTGLEPGMPPVVLAAGADQVTAAQQARLLELFGDALAPWPGVAFQDGGRLTAGMRVGGQLPVRYSEGLGAEHAGAAFFLPRLLAEAAGVPDRDRRLAWYEAAGVPVRAGREIDAISSDIDASRPVERPDELRLLRAHADQPTDPSLRRLLRDAAGQVEIQAGELRLVVTSRGEGWLCAAVAGADDGDDVPGIHGCWEAR